MVLRVAHGKGPNDRYVMLSPRLLAILRDWWRLERPPHWLFPGRPDVPVIKEAVERACHRAQRRSRVPKRITPHLLRHYAFAVHLLEAGDRRVHDRVRGDRQPAVGRSAKEDGIDDGLVLEHDLGDGLRDGERRRGRYGQSSRSVCRCATQAARACAWHMGQCGLRQLLYQTRWCPHWSHCSTWPPSAAVRHCSMACITRRWAVDSSAPARARNAAAKHVCHRGPRPVAPHAAVLCRGRGGRTREEFEGAGRRPADPDRDAPMRSPPESSAPDRPHSRTPAPSGHPAHARTAPAWGRCRCRRRPSRPPRCRAPLRRPRRPPARRSRSPRSRRCARRGRGAPSAHRASRRATWRRPGAGEAGRQPNSAAGPLSTTRRTRRSDGRRAGSCTTSGSASRPGSARTLE
jgi:hypothetical protein